MKRIDTITTGWKDYQLLDSGDGRKLEQFGAFLLDRPDTQTLWHKSVPAQWSEACAQFVWAEKGERWKIDKGIPEQWTFSWKDMIQQLSFKGFKHIGIFPEHSAQWELLHSLGKRTTGLRMLNLFGYTGAASVAAALGGMTVTHVDASKQTVQIVKENAVLSGLTTESIRVITEDTLKYVKRLIARGEQFEVIVLDPPAFGRGPKGEVWKIEESLAELLELIPQLLSKNARMVILNGYAAGYSARTFAELLKAVLPSGTICYGDVGIAVHNSEKQLPTGIYAMWTN
ncbi:class I SAM-dependent methyltransferase [Patescibacteria group bacterium]|nr:class I SAM-dependent methyltransferase [Patescibacteria group bacterium]